MYQFHIQELDVEVGEIVVCVSDDSTMFTSGAEYEVDQVFHHRLGLMCDCGFVATTSASLFTPIELLESSVIKTTISYPWQLLSRIERGVKLGELVYIGSGTMQHSVKTDWNNIRAA